MTIWLLCVTAVLSSVWSFIGARELDVWVFELLPGALGVVGVVWLSRRFRFSSMAYVAISVSFVFIATGARYTYSEVPLANWLQEVGGWSRNHFDRAGHLLQGLTVAMLTREVLLRTTPLPRWAAGLVTVAFALAFSAFYELVEWWCVLLFYSEEGPEWLGMQGDPWDAQWDMTMALSGALTTVLVLFRAHDRSVQRRLRECGSEDV